jgi:hypothetical protein
LRDRLWLNSESEEEVVRAKSNIRNRMEMLLRFGAEERCRVVKFWRRR